jgi:hypothetical protein
VEAIRLTIVASSVSGLPRQLLVIGGEQPMLDRVPLAA